MMATGLERIAIVGAGLMGTYLALDWARAGHPITIYDADAERSRTLPERAREIGAQLVRGGVTDQAALDEALRRLTPAADLRAAVDQADYVVEAIIEDLAAKQAVFRELDALCPARTVLASNTSSLMPSALAERTRHPERVVVVHYFFPAHLLPAVEVVRGPRTSDQTVEVAVRMLRRAGKTPAVLQKEVPGFVAPRLQAAMLREALHLVEEGVIGVEDLDALVSGGFGRRLADFGPFGIADLAGLDIWQTIAAYLFPLLSDAKRPSALLAERAARGDLGVKSGRGFYEWTPEQGQAARARQDAGLLRFLTPDER